MLNNQMVILCHHLPKKHHFPQKDCDCWGFPTQVNTCRFRLATAKYIKWKTLAGLSKYWGRKYWGALPSSATLCVKTGPSQSNSVLSKPYVSSNSDLLEHWKVFSQWTRKVSMVLLGLSQQLLCLKNLKGKPGLASADTNGNCTSNTSCYSATWKNSEKHI